ncbi:MAG TPA: hypothetical protein DIC60_09695 [Lachnospiraceae bacterium]|nr:hypothetical protein [Lachnospiraceae bacterium]
MDIKDRLKNEVNSWVTPSENDKRILPFVADLNGGWKIIKYVLYFGIYLISINFTCGFYEGLYNLLNRIPSILEKNNYSIRAIIGILIIGILFFIVIVVSLSISILCYDKNVVKNEKLTKTLFVYFLIQALINSKLLESGADSIVTSLLP